MALNFQNQNGAPVRRVLLIVLLVLSLVMATVYSREGESGPLHTVQGAVSSLSSSLKLLGASASSGARNVGDAITDASASDATLSELREQNAELRQLVAQTEEYRQEVERLQGLLDLRDSSGAEGVGGRIIGRNTDAWNQTVTIDVGSSSGVTSGLTVMGPTGVIGQVVSTTDTTSTVRLLSDPQSGAAALIQSSRAEGVVRGSLDGLLYLENVDSDVQVSVGDVVLTSGLGGSYTRGLLIGTVVKIEGNQGDATRRIVVSQNDEAKSLEEVFVVTSVSADSSSSSSGSSNGSGSSSSDSGSSSSSSSSSSTSSGSSSQASSSSSR